MLLIINLLDACCFMKKCFKFSKFLLFSGTIFLSIDELKIQKIVIYVNNNFNNKNLNLFLNYNFFKKS